MTNLIDDIKRDQSQGTPGPWQVGASEEYAMALASDETGNEYFWEIATACPTEFETDDYSKTMVFGGCINANARRIARVPAMESALLAAVELVEATESYIRHTKAGVKGETCPIAWLLAESGAESAAEAFRKALEQGNE